MNLRDALQSQARACANLGSPFTAQLMRVVSENLTGGTRLSDRLLNWPGNVSASGESVPLRLAGALYSLVLLGKSSELASVYPPIHAPDDSKLWDAVDHAMHDHVAHIDAWINRPHRPMKSGAVLF